MKNDCDKGDQINSIENSQMKTDKKVDQVIANQKSFQQTMEKYFGRLEDILVADIEHKKDIERLIDTVVEMKEQQKEINGIQFDKLRNLNEDTQQLKQFKAIYDEMHIADRVGGLYDDKMAHKGFRKHRSDIYAAIGFFILVVNFFWDKITITP